MRNLSTIILTLLWSCVSLTAFSQVELSKETTDKQKKQKKEKPTDGKNQMTEVFLQANWSYTSRKLVPNDGFFGDSLGSRANETGVGAWSGGIGLRNTLGKYLVWEGGISFFQNGEQYNFEATDSDSTYTYTTKYMYISMPLKLYFTYGESIQLMAGVGLVPQMFLRYRQNLEYTDAENKQFDEEIKLKSGYNPFALSAVFNLGVKFRLSEAWSFYVMPEYKHQLTSSYVKNASYKHFGRSIGLNVGFSIHL